MGEESSFLVQDLIGCTVVNEGSEVLGELMDVMKTGANDIFVVGTGANEILIPALKDVVLKIDVANRRINVKLPKGLKESGHA